MLNFVWSKSISQLAVLRLTAEELDWYKADIACRQTGQGWHLPSITQLLGLFYFNTDTGWQPATDYWSDTRLIGRGFGLNTRLGTPSFDVLGDQDHFICVREQGLPVGH